MNFIFGPIFILALLTVYCNSLCFDEIEERHQCSETPPIQTDIDETWVNSISNWYIPIWNKVELYQNAKYFYGAEDFKSLTQNDLDQTCATYNQTGSRVTFVSFGGYSIEYNAFSDPIRAGVQHWSFNDEYIATSYTTLSDNVSLIVDVCYWVDGRKGFLVGSPNKILDENASIRVKNHLISLGFKTEHFVDYNYQSCYD